MPKFIVKILPGGVTLYDTNKTWSSFLFVLSDTAKLQYTETMYLHQAHIRLFTIK